MAKRPKMSLKFILALANSFVIYPLLIWTGWLLSPGRGLTKEFGYTFLVGLGGVAVGSMLGFLASPYNRSEKTAFSEYGKALATFLTGYLLSKIDKLLEVLADPASLETRPIYGARALVFLIAALTAATLTYVFRMYYDAGEAFVDREPPTAAE